MGISNFTEETDISRQSLDLTLSGADQTFISVCLNENIVNDAISIYRGFLDSSNALIADPFLLYKGMIETFGITESGNATPHIGFSTEFTKKQETCCSVVTLQHHKNLLSGTSETQNCLELVNPDVRLCKMLAFTFP